MRCVLSVLFILWIACLPAQDNFGVDKIPAFLKNDANAVVRLDEVEFTREDIHKAVTRRRLVITVFNETGEAKYASYRLFYDGFNKIRKLEGKLYDEKGKVVTKLTKKNITEYSSEYYRKGNISDNREKYAFFGKKKYKFPYTVEFVSTEEHRNLMFYPYWNFFFYKGVGIQKASLVIRSPHTFSIRYKEANVSPCVITEDNKIKAYSWNLENTLIPDDEPYVWRSTLPYVITSPVEYAVEGHYGHITGWTDISRFYYDLNKGRDELPESIKLKVKELTQNEQDTMEKIKKLYTYLQANTRYMSIQLGIGGWQTMSAMEVAGKGYGDCKALSNYMQALLKEAGITSYAALINAGFDRSWVTDDFPCLLFNHVIVCVPLGKDSLWLECTNPNNTIGYLGSFTGNRKALIIKPRDGNFVKTINYTAAQNTESRKAIVVVDSNGNARAMVRAVLRGIPQEELAGIYHNYDKVRQERYITDHLTIPDFELRAFTLRERKTNIPEMEETLDLNIKKIVSASGSLMFLNANLLASSFKTPANPETRKSMFYLDPEDFSFRDVDTIVYKLPSAYTIGHLPKPLGLHSKFGNYNVDYKIEGETLTYIRSFEMTGGVFPAEDYVEFTEFIKKVNKSDRQQVTFTRKR